MYKHTVKSYLAWFLLLLCYAFEGASQQVLANSVSDNTITWTPLDFPPFYIVKGRHAKAGIADEIEKVITQRLTQYRFMSMSSNLARFQEDLKVGKNMANPAILKTPEREAFMLFTVPVYLTPPNGITVLRTRAREFSADGQAVSFEQLIKNKSLKCGIAKGRKYGKAVDEWLKSQEGQSHIEVRAGGDAYEGLFQMLLKGRVDYIVGFPHEAVFFEKELDKNGLTASFSLKENPDYLLSRVALPKTPWGEKVRTDMNAVLIKERKTDAWRAITEKWLDASQIADYRAKYKDVFLKTE